MHHPAGSVRRFNRFYTKQIGLLRKGYLDSPYSLSELRVLYELAHREQPTATDLVKELDMDAGYLSRVLLRFQKRGLILRRPSKRDGRQYHLSLTAKGRKDFGQLEKKTEAEVEAMVSKLSPTDQRRLTEAMGTIENLLCSASRPDNSFTLRQHQPGDMGWVIHRHGALYHQEYGWDERFEALVAEIAAKFIQEFDPTGERCWIAEKAGAIVGSVFLVRKSATVAKLRLLLVEPSTRGLGIGHRLVSECIAFAREAGYRKITLWTQSNLYAARHIYKKAGFCLVSATPQDHFGHDLVSEVWDLNLDSPVRGVSATRARAK